MWGRPLHHQVSVQAMHQLSGGNTGQIHGGGGGGELLWACGAAG